MFTQTNSSRHAQDLSRICKLKGWRLVQDATMRILDGSSLYTIAWRSRQYKNYIFGDDWEYAEVGFKTRGNSGLNVLRKKTVIYSIMSVKLPRKLPNVVFDSHKHQRRQFRLIFDPRQYIQLEGNFSKYFATYFGNEYKIDDLSFITPEVMEAMITADDYDIEIVHDRLLLFGPVQTDAQKQLEEMSKAILLIRKKLLHNIVTYRDERVPYDQGRKVVARAGMFLQGRPLAFWDFVLLAFYLLRILVIAIVLMFIISEVSELMK